MNPVARMVADDGTGKIKYAIVPTRTEHSTTQYDIGDALIFTGSTDWRCLSIVALFRNVLASLSRDMSYFLARGWDVFLLYLIACSIISRSLMMAGGEWGVLESR